MLICLVLRFFIFDTTMYFFFFFYCYGDHLDLHSFPTRRSSDLSLLCVRSSEPPPRLPPSIFLAAAKVRLTAPRFSSDRKSTRLNSSHTVISYAVFCLKKKNNEDYNDT